MGLSKVDPGGGCLFQGRLDMFMVSPVLGQEVLSSNVLSNTFSILYGACSSCSLRLWHLLPHTSPCEPPFTTTSLA